MPLIFRFMFKDVDDKPTIADEDGLGVRCPPPGAGAVADVRLDPQGNVRIERRGMSVAPHWRLINLLRVPVRLVEGGTGDPDTYVFTHGDGPFAQAMVAAGLELLPDNKIPLKHGIVRPTALVPLAYYRASLEATQDDWTFIPDAQALQMP